MLDKPWIAIDTTSTPSTSKLSLQLTTRIKQQFINYLEPIVLSTNTLKAKQSAGIVKERFTSNHKLICLRKEKLKQWTAYFFILLNLLFKQTNGNQELNHKLRKRQFESSEAPKRKSKTALEWNLCIIFIYIVKRIHNWRSITVRTSRFGPRALRSFHKGTIVSY